MLGCGHGFENDCSYIMYDMSADSVSRLGLTELRKYGALWNDEGGVPMLETTELGLNDSLLPNAVERGTGMATGVIAGVQGAFTMSETCKLAGEVAAVGPLQVTLRSSMAVNDGAADIWSYNLSSDPFMAMTSSESETPRS